MKKIIGTKVGMLQLFEASGKQLAATVVYCEPNKVLEVKSQDKNKSVKVGYWNVKENKLTKTQLGIFKKAKSEPKRYIKTLSGVEGYNVGDEIKADIFAKGDYIDVQGKTKGHGFTGAIKRWNFKIGPMSHGAGFPHRYQGSVAFGRGGSQAQRVPKGKKMAGQYGHETVTIQNLVVLDVIPNRNLIIILGAIPGPDGSIVTIKQSVKKPNKKFEYQIITKELKEEILKQNEALEDKEALREANLEAEVKEQAEQEAAEAAKKAEELAREKEKAEYEKQQAAQEANNGGNQQNKG